MTSSNRIPGWFPKENRERLTRLIEAHNVKTVIEVGCFMGKSTVFFAKDMGCDVMAIDTFEAHKLGYLNQAQKILAKDQHHQHQILVKILEENGVKDKVTIVQATSLMAAAWMPQADLIYIDGSHKYEDVRRDLAAWFPQASKVVCGDDYTDGWPGVKQAVDEAGRFINKDQRLWFYEKHAGLVGAK